MYISSIFMIIGITLQTLIFMLINLSDKDSYGKNRLNVISIWQGVKKYFKSKRKNIPFINTTKNAYISNYYKMLKLPLKKAIFASIISFIILIISTNIVIAISNVVCNKIFNV